MKVNSLHRTFSFLRQDFLSQASYRIQMLLSIAGLILTIVPIYFVAQALQPTVAESIKNQGDQYFGFLVLGIATERFLWQSINALPMAVQSGIRTGTLEALFSTPVPVVGLFGGMMSYRILWGLFQATALLAAGWVLGIHLETGHLLAGVGIGLLISMAYIPFGILAAAGILAFRTSGPLLMVVNVGSVLLGGVYYPTHVIPSWMQSVSALIPLTYGLRALRQTLLEGFPIQAVAGDLTILLCFIVLLGGVAVYLLARALRYARESGSLAQY